MLLQSPLTSQREARRSFKRPVETPLGALPDLPLPLALQQRAQESLRAHVQRGAVRGAVLVTGDAVVLLGLRSLLHTVRESSALGSQIATIAHTLFPQGATRLPEVLVAMLLGLFVSGSYGAGDARHDASRLLSGSAAGLALIFWGLLWTDLSAYPLVGYLLATAIAGAGLLAERTVVDVVVCRVRARSEHSVRSVRALVVGTSKDELGRLSAPPLTGQAQFAIAGFVDIDAHPHPRALGGVSDLPRIIQAHHIDTVIIRGNVERQLFDTLLHVSNAAGCQVLAAPPSLTIPDFTPQLVWHGGTALIQLTRPALRGQQLVLKRGFDLIVSIAGMLVAAPLGLLIAAAICITSPGPAIFRQERVGLGGRRFWIYKFRSMVRDAETRREELGTQSMYDDERLFKIRKDPRITAVGTFLRRTSLDELPQLINVLRGEMSLVGPRPPLPSEVKLYEERHYARFNMKPGITGPWQVSGRSNITEFERVVQLETSYISQWSIWKDFAILFRTIPVVLRMDGAH